MPHGRVRAGERDREGGESVGEDREGAGGVRVCDEVKKDKYPYFRKTKMKGFVLCIGIGMSETNRFVLLPISPKNILLKRYK